MNELVRNLDMAEKSLTNFNPHVYTAKAHAMEALNLAEDLEYNIDSDVRAIIKKTYPVVITDIHGMVEKGNFSGALSGIMDYTRFCERVGVDLSMQFRPVIGYIEFLKQFSEKVDNAKPGDTIILGKI